MTNLTVRRSGKGNMCTVTNTAGLNIHIKEGAAVAIFTGFNEEDTLICDDWDPLYAKAEHVFRHQLAEDETKTSLLLRPSYKIFPLCLELGGPNHT